MNWQTKRLASTRASLSRAVFCNALLTLSLALFFHSVFFPSDSFADTFDFGGSPERFGEAGDRKPPRCQIDVPRAAQSSFFIKWNCTDDEAADDQIRTSLWILKNGARAPEKLKDFLGFPASIFVDEGILGNVENFADGLPAAFRLVASDRAGTSTVSSYFIVAGRDNSVGSCSLELVTDPTESDGSTTGTPSRQVLLSDVSVQTTQVGNNDVTISTFAATTATPCEIDDVCRNNSEVSFEAAITFDETDGSSTAAGSITVEPGLVLANLEGTANVSDSALTSLQASGTTTANGVAIGVTLSCSQ